VALPIRISPSRRGSPYRFPIPEGRLSRRRISQYRCRGELLLGLRVPEPGRICAAGWTRRAEDHGNYRRFEAAAALAGAEAAAVATTTYIRVYRRQRGNRARRIESIKRLFASELVSFERSTYGSRFQGFGAPWRGKMGERARERADSIISQKRVHGHRRERRVGLTCCW
jgi:hypothetical protein